MYQFTITIASDGDNATEAWNEAVNALAMEPGSTPEDYKLLNENDVECIKCNAGTPHEYWENPDFWDCNCKTSRFIHSKVKGNYCPLCKSFEEECSDSRVHEIAENYDPQYDNAVPQIMA
jgi:hypothetical protein